LSGIGMTIEFLERPLFEKWTVARDRWRAHLARMRGADLASHSRIGPRCRIKRPWRLKAGERLQLEWNIYVKIESEDASVVFGDDVFVGFGSELDVTGELRIGHKVLIGPGCFLTDHNHIHRRDGLIADQGVASMPVTLHDDVWLGANVVVLPGVTVGRGAIAAAGAVLTRDVRPFEIVAGVPARTIGERS
jgi:acetyltransferase-like isoleucine patch superfamily enzyme